MIENENKLIDKLLPRNDGTFTYLPTHEMVVEKINEIVEVLNRRTTDGCPSR